MRKLLNGIVIILLGMGLSESTLMAGEINYATPKPMIQSSMVFAEASTMATKPAKPEPFKPSWFTANKWHQYFGLGSLALAGMAAIAPKPSPDDAESGVHHSLAQGAAYLGGAAIASGLVFHYKDLSWHNLTKNPDNWHAVLGTLGVLGYVAANADAPDGNHPTYGIAGAVSMLAAIKITW